MEIIVTRANSLCVFETKPADLSAEFYYDSSEALPITNGFHIAGSADGNLASGIVPDDKLLALKELIIEDVTNAAPLVN
jgi:hypothetical protein